LSFKAASCATAQRKDHHEKLVRRSEDMLAVLLLHGCDLENAMNLLARSEEQLRKALELMNASGSDVA
jgi:hypothetical protein